jgi:hypothetical protein
MIPDPGSRRSPPNEHVSSQTNANVDATHLHQNYLCTCRKKRLQNQKSLSILSWAPGDPLYRDKRHQRQGERTDILP